MFKHKFYNKYTHSQVNISFIIIGPDYQTRERGNLDLFIFDDMDDGVKLFYVFTDSSMENMFSPCLCLKVRHMFRNSDSDFIIL